MPTVQSQASSITKKGLPMKGTALSSKETTIRPATPGQMKDVYSLMIQAVPELTFEEATLLLRRKGEIIPKIQDCFPQAKGDSALASWELFYREVFGLGVDLSGLKIPERRDGFDRLIVIASGLTINQAYDACAKHFRCWKYADDLDAEVTENSRTSSQSYAIWVRESVEADPGLANKSADDLALDPKFKGVTILERIIHELKFFLETGKHLDIENVTLCSGSLNSGGLVPDASWYGDKFRVNWDARGNRLPYLRAREAVTL